MFDVPDHLDPFDVFYTDANGIRSQAGWYWLAATRHPVGPYHAEHSARQAADEAQNREES